MRGDGWWEWWVDGIKGGSASQRTGWARIGEIGAWLKERNWEFIPETRGSILEERSVIRREDDVDGRASVTKDEERVLRRGWTVMRLWRYEGWVVVRTVQVSERSLYDRSCADVLVTRRSTTHISVWHQPLSNTMYTVAGMWLIRVLCQRWINR